MTGLDFVIDVGSGVASVNAARYSIDVSAISSDIAYVLLHKGECTTLPSSGPLAATPVIDPGIYQPQLNAWMTDAAAAGLTVAAAKIVKAGFIDTIYNAKRQSLVVSFQPIEFATALSASAPGLSNANTWSATSTTVVTNTSPFTGNSGIATASVALAAGKLYWEASFPVFGGGTSSDDIGIIAPGASLSNPVGDNASGYSYRYYDGSKGHGHTYTSYGVACVQGDIVSVAFDGSNLWFATNGVWQGGATAAEIASGITTHAAFTGLSGSFIPALGVNVGSDTGQLIPSGFHFPAPANFHAPSGSGSPWSFSGDDISVQNVAVIAAGGGGGAVSDIGGTVHNLSSAGVAQLASLVSGPRSTLMTARDTLQTQLAALTTVNAVIAFDATAGWPFTLWAASALLAGSGGLRATVTGGH